MSEKTKPVLQVDHLTKCFGGLTAVSDVTMHIDEGEFVGLIGPNGAGKTTFFNNITGNLTPTQGTVLFNGKALLAKIPRRFHTWVLAAHFRISVFSRK